MKLEPIKWLVVWHGAAWSLLFLALSVAFVALFVPEIRIMAKAIVVEAKAIVVEAVAPYVPTLRVIGAYVNALSFLALVSFAGYVMATKKG